MKKYPLTVVFVGLTIGAAFADPGSDLLEKVKGKYATCASFYCEGKNTTISTMQGKEKPHKMENKFSVKFQRPNLLRVDWIKPSSSTFTPDSCSLYTKNGKYFGLPGFRPSVEEFKTLEDGMGAYAGISGGATYMMPSLLLGQKGYFYDVTCKLGEEKKMDNRACFTLLLADKKTGDWTVWIDKVSLAILRTKQIHTIKAEESKKLMEEVTKTLKDQNLPLPNLPKEDYTIQTEVDYTSVTFDQQMKVDEFEYKEPQSAALP